MMALQNQSGTDEQRSSCRIEAISYVFQFGPPCFFWTITPTTRGSYIVSSYCGRYGRTSEDYPLESLHHYHAPPSKAERAADVANNPHAAVQHFRNILHLLMKVLWGWDCEKGCSSNTRGLAGQMKAFYGMMECNGAYNLHCHMLGWVQEWPATSSLLDQALADPQHLTELLQLVDGIISADSPATIDEVTCPVCGEACGWHQAPELDVLQLRMRPKSVPLAAQCRGCGTRLSCDSLLERALNHLTKQSTNEHFRNNIGEYIDKAAAGARPFMNDLGAVEQKILLHHLLLQTQLHDWLHRPGCFAKQQKSCRFRKPDAARDSTGFDHNGRLQIHRNIACLYITPTVVLVTEYFAHNNDFKVIVTKNGSNLLEYTLKYTTKRQDKSDIQALLAQVALDSSKAIERAELREADNNAQGVESSIQSIVKSRIAGVLFAATSKLELPSQMCVYLMQNGGSPSFQSHQHLTIKLHTFLHWLANDPVQFELRLQDKGNNYTLNSPILQWKHRPAELSMMCLHDFTLKYYDTTRPKQKTSKNNASQQTSTSVAREDASDEIEELLDEVAQDYLGNTEQQEDKVHGDDVEGHEHESSKIEDRDRPPRGRLPIPRLLYLISHPYFTSRSLASRTDKTIANTVVIHRGPSPPDHMKARSVLADTHASVAAKEAAAATLDLYAKMGLILFATNGWRHPADLKPEEFATAIGYFDYLFDHKQLAPCAYGYLSRWQDWYVSTLLRLINI
jgi:hypothetical protein